MSKFQDRKLQRSVDGFPDILTVEEVSILLRMNKKSIYEAIKRGDIPCKKIGRVYRLSKKLVLKLLDGQDRVSLISRR